MSKKQLSSREEIMIRAFLTYNEEQLKKLEENDGDIILIDKIKENIKLYEKQLKVEQ